jgi:hypothetical protein
MKKSIVSLFAYSILFTGITLIISCGSMEKPQGHEGQISISAYDSSQGKSFTYSKYELPLSVDIFTFLKSNQFPYNILLMHKIKEQDKYFTDFQRAFVLVFIRQILAMPLFTKEARMQWNILVPPLNWHIS